MDHTMSPEQKRALAADPTTDTETLTQLANDWALRSLVVANPATPEDVRNRLLEQWPYLKKELEQPPDEIDTAYANLRARAASKPRPTVPSSTYAPPNGGSGRYVEMIDAQGQRVQVPATYVTGRPATNGFAIASLITGLLGLSLLAVIFGHTAGNQIQKSGEGGAGMAAGGLVLGYLGLVFGLIVIIALF